MIIKSMYLTNIASIAEPTFGYTVLMGGNAQFSYVTLYESFIHQEHGSTIIVARKKLDI